MAEETQDQSQKTEEPTHKRLEDARRKGQVATSREVNNWFMILGGTIAVMAILPAEHATFAWSCAASSNSRTPFPSTSAIWRRFTATSYRNSG
jgi:flagellar biosynthesis protein FlhB